MVSKFALLSNLLLASAVLAAPSSRLGARLARRRENRQSKPVNHVALSAGPDSNILEYDTNWAGVAFQKDSGTFTSVTGTFTVPTPSGSDGASSAWVGIDGFTCDNAILQTGVDFELNGGVPSYEAWYEWFPGYSQDFSDFTINAGDVIVATVTAYSTNVGVATLENQTTGQTATQGLTSGAALCEQNAEWIVENYERNGILVPFGDFGTVTFTDATATDSSGNIYTPSDVTATIMDIRQNNVILTAVSTSGETVTIQYV